MKRGPKSLVIRKMQIKTTMRYYFIHIRMAIIKKLEISVSEDVEKSKPSCTVGKHIKW
jgi:hypothetical protein